MMRTIEAARRSGIGVAPTRSVGDAAAIMDQAGVGALAVIDGHQLVGIVTDRDIVCRCVAQRAPLETTVASIMSQPVITIDADADLYDVFGLYRKHAVRRLAVVRDQNFVGMITVDDLLMDLAADLGDLTRPVTAEVLFGRGG